MSRARPKSRLTHFLQDGFGPLLHQLRTVACVFNLGELDFPTAEFASGKSIYERLVEAVHPKGQQEPYDLVAIARPASRS